MTSESAGLGDSSLRLTRRNVIIGASLLLFSAIGVLVVQFSLARNGVLQGDAVIGGDYAAFYAAARTAEEGAPETAYDAGAFEALIQQWAPPRERYGLTWQYPPTYFFLVLPLAFLPFAAGYVLWTGATAAAFFAALRAAGFRGLLLFVILAAPSTFHAVITGQNGFLTAALLTLAAIFPDRRPIVAGLAAALLTVKPQLGVLIPIAYIAGGCWRAFFVAAIGALALAGASVAAFGAESWDAFLSGVLGASDNLATGALPLYKMVTPFAALRLTGSPAEIAGAFQLLTAVLAAGAIALVWRRVKDADLRAAALCAGVFFAAPYGFYYELVILALPAAILARRAIESGSLKYEQLALAFIFLFPLILPGEAKKLGLSLGFIIVLTVAACVWRRIAHEHPQALRLRRHTPA